MILEFSATNFRSIDDEQTIRLYMVGNQGGHLGNAAQIPNCEYRALKAVGMYGANASGKSNFVKAIDALRLLLNKCYSLHKEDSIPGYDPCLFRDKDKPRETTFVIEFVLALEDGTYPRFKYEIAYDDVRVAREALYAYFTNRESLLFERESPESESIRFGAAYKGGQRKIAVFANQSFLSVAGQRAESPEIIQKVSRYLRGGIRVLEAGAGAFVDPKKHEAAARILKYVDAGVNAVRHVVKEPDPAVLERIPLPDDIRKQYLEFARNHYIFEHEAENGQFVDIDLEQESDGTQRLFYRLPWLVDVFRDGGVIVMDELDDSMHPFMAEMIVRLFNDPEVNKFGAQLVYSTHNSNLLSSDLLRRDQIWFVEKKNGRSRYFSLDDFDKRVVTPASPYVKWYLEGRFGAIPAIDYMGVVSCLKSLCGKEEPNA